MSSTQQDQLDEIERVKEIQTAIVAPYLDNTEDQDTADYHRILWAIGKMNKLSTQTIQDVIDELQGELDSRP